MVKYEELVKSETQFRAMTGLDVVEFRRLVPSFQVAYELHMREWNRDGSVREARSYSEYKNSPLPTIEEKLLFILVYAKQMPTQTVQGMLFGMSQSKANGWIHLLQPLLNEALGYLQMLPARTEETLVQQLEIATSLGIRRDVTRGDEPASGEKEAVAEDEADALGGQVFWHDGTERPIPRPKDQETQKECYSGKKNSIP